MNIRFIAEDNDSVIAKAVIDYKNIWQEEGQEIVSELENITKLPLNEDNLEATIYEGPSSSHPLKLRASYPLKTKKATLIHELGHRVLVSNGIIPDKLDSHQVLNLFLYDIWVNLYGKGWANKEVQIEKERSGRYQKAWEWALSKSSTERKDLLAYLIKTLKRE